MNATATARQFKIKAIVDDVNSCECCGKTGLVRTVAIENLETGEIKYFGTTCAMQPAKGFAIEKAEMKSAMKAYDAAAFQARLKEGKRKSEAFMAAKSELYAAKGGQFKTVAALPGSSWGEFEIPADSELMAACHQELAYMLK